MERTGGEGGCQIDQALNSETPLGSRESTRTTRNGVDLRNASDTGRRGHFTGSGNGRIEAVSIGRDQAPRPCSGAVREGHGNLIGE